jgi:hypothetical protein
VDEIIINSNIRDGLLSTVESKRAVPFQDVERWVSVTRTTVGKTKASRWRTEDLKRTSCLYLPFVTLQTLEF